MNLPEPSSLTASVTAIAAAAHVVGVAFLGRTPALALANGDILLCAIGEERRIAAHPDAAILVTASDGRRLVSGGDEGRVVATDANGAMQEIANTGGKWIDALALHRDGAIAYAAARDVRVCDPKGEVKYWQAPTSALVNS